MLKWCLQIKIGQDNFKFSQDKIWVVLAIWQYTQKISGSPGFYMNCDTTFTIDQERKYPCRYEERYDQTMKLRWRSTILTSSEELLSKI